MSQRITCPKCHHSFEPTEAFASEVTAQVERLLAEREAELQAAHDALVGEHQRKSGVLEAELRQAQAKQASLLQEKEALAEKNERFERELQTRLVDERERIRAEEREASHKREQIQVESVRSELASSFSEKEARREQELQEMRDGLRRAQQQEFSVREENRQLLHQAEQLEIEMRRKVDAERESIRATAMEQAREEGLFQVKEKDLLISQLRDRIRDMQRKVEQGSQQVQGEVQELVLEDLLRQEFPFDRFREVPKGVEGADIIQEVRTRDGRSCGTILWESKRTKAWSDGWLPKLRGDQREIRAEVCAIVTQVLPSDVASIGERDGVWVCGFSFMVPMARLLRAGLEEVSRVRRTQAGQETKMQQAYEYLTGTDFRLRVQGVVESLEEMSALLEKEKKAMRNLWRKRERQIHLATDGVFAMQQDLKGIAGSDLADLSTLEDSVAALEVLGESYEELDSEELVQEFLQTLQQLDGRAGNQKLREHLGWDEAVYDRVKAALVDREVVRLGRGRGGTVQLRSGEDEGGYAA